tara:strand:- start:392 stop:700 length:309 start_codon:yes stop_codon:yes gene_type:complete
MTPLHKKRQHGRYTMHIEPGRNAYKTQPTENIGQRFTGQEMKTAYGDQAKNGKARINLNNLCRLPFFHQTAKKKRTRTPKLKSFESMQPSVRRDRLPIRNPE